MSALPLPAMPEENQVPPAAPKPEAAAPEGSTAPARPPRPPKPAAAGDDAPAAEGEAARPARPKPADAPAKPLPEYIQEDILPMLEKRMKAEGATDVALSGGPAEFSATWDDGNKTFTIYFDEANLEGRKTISFTQQAKSRFGGRSVLSFMPPERGFKGVDAKQIVAMIMQQFTTTLTWIRKKDTAAASGATGAGGAKKPPRPRPNAG